MKNIKILGTGCAKCKQTTAVVERAIAELGLTDVTIEKVEDIQKIMEFDIMTTPAIVVDNEVIIKGRVPSLNELKELIQ